MPIDAGNAKFREHILVDYKAFLFLWRQDAILGHDFPLRGFVMTLIGHITFGRTPLDE